ncbi:heavy metal translocating P-type ATPase [Candidatus Formimonas warabiya]|uniref:Cadmium-translocating P-type ATPase n=1 Tax=Formimonas warabiya TaxID=1761012 RepID=A0A3G1KYR0_FORW1|nr:heavy metal translocating P-type ATPase [Candidatus Formimonas warabiya]ATW27592.1 cadmium-translocating P-type ATPase [Candidatus Formimonas warabiya]
MINGLKKELILEGLDCAHCALKIEQQVNNMAGVASASLNFATQTLTIQGGEGSDLQAILSGTNKIVKELEPHVKVMEKREAQKEDLLPAQPSNVKKIIRIGTGAFFFLMAILFSLPSQGEFALYLVSFLLVGGDILLKAGKNITQGRILDENFLMSLASLGAFAIGEYPEGAAVMLFYQVGEFFQDLAVNRSRQSIAALMDIRPDYANLKIGSEIRKVSPEEVSIGDLILVKPGEKVPLDGQVREGTSSLDTSSLTGESIPQDVERGSLVLSGAVNKNGLLTVEVTKRYSDSTVAKILEMVQNAGSKKAPTENFITKFARYYTPFVVGTAVLLAFLPPLFIPGASFTQWINRALVFLVVSCPCALVVSIPLGFFGGIGGASRRGILIKGGNYLEALNKVDTVVFDKTGTLTKGVFQVTQVVNKGELTNADLLEYAAYAESYSNHPIALSIQRAFGREIDARRISGYEEISGHGTKVTMEGRAVLAGNDRLMEQENILYEDPEIPGTIVHLAVDGAYAGYIVIADEIKSDSLKAVKALRDLGVKKLVMLTGDSKRVGEQIGKELALDEIYAELLPDQKVHQLEHLTGKSRSGGNLVFVGDGINDAPVLARADIGVAMGGLGSDAAIEAADIVLMTDEPSKLAEAIKIAKKTRNIVWQNIILALSIKGIVLILGAGGLATMWEAVFADVGVALLAVLNAMRAIRGQA